MDEGKRTRRWFQYSSRQWQGLSLEAERGQKSRGVTQQELWIWRLLGVAEREGGATDGSQVVLIWAVHRVECIEGHRRTDVRYWWWPHTDVQEKTQPVTHCSGEFSHAWKLPDFIQKQRTERKCMCSNIRWKRRNIVGMLWSQLPKIIPKLNSSYCLKLSLGYGIMDYFIFFIFQYFLSFIIYIIIYIMYNVI